MRLDGECRVPVLPPQQCVHQVFVIVPAHGPEHVLGICHNKHDADRRIHPLDEKGLRDLHAAAGPSRAIETAPIQIGFVL